MVGHSSSDVAFVIAIASAIAMTAIPLHHARAPDGIRIALAAAAPDTPAPAPVAAPVAGPQAQPSVGAGGCGPRAVRVWDPFAKTYTTRQAEVCWRTLS